MNDTIEIPQKVEFFNVENPGDIIFISRDPDYDKLENKALAQDKYAHFRAGLFSTSDPEIIEALNSPQMRKKGVRCMSNPEDVAEYGTAEDRQSFIEAEIERRVAERLEERKAIEAHAQASPDRLSRAELAESVSPE